MSSHPSLSIPPLPLYLKLLLLFLFTISYLVGKTEAASVNGDQTPDGKPCQVVLPQGLRLHNVGGSDGAGLCVFTSITHSARVQNVPVLSDFQKWMKTKPGGGYPEKVDKMIDQICREKNTPKPIYIQVEGTDFDILQRACESGRMPGITYSVSPSGRYGGQRIAHMVNLCHCDGKTFGILDNNYEKEIEYLNEAEFRKAYCGGSKGWAVILLNPGMIPPEPRN